MAFKITELRDIVDAAKSDRPLDGTEHGLDFGGRPDIEGPSPPGLSASSAL